MKKKIGLAEWLRDHPLISQHALEKETGLPQSTINKVLKHGRSFTAAHDQRLKKVLKHYGLK